MKALVTGSNGLLGCNLTRVLLQAGHSVRTLVRESSDTRGLDRLNVERSIGDVRDRESVRAAVDGCDVVFHGAAVFSYWGYSRDEMLETARDGTGIIIEACRDANVRRLVLTSSTAVFGGHQDPTPRDETAAMAPGAGVDYFETKALQERIAAEMARELGVELIIVNPSLFIGPYDFKPSQSSQTFTAFLRDPLRLTFPGGACLVHAGDVARGHLLALENGTPFERHILGGENIEWTALHETLAVLTDSAGPRLRANKATALLGAAVMEAVSTVTRRPPMVTRALARQMGLFFYHSSEKMKRLGYAPRPAKATLRDTLNWWIESPHLSAKERLAWRPQL
ncbi:MAG: NAD-dependent epimerase/dehydratase family protein [Myxococcota bacterium]